MKFINIEVPCIIQEHCDGKRLVRWYEYDNMADENCCVHGIKLRWSCDDCEEYFESEEEDG